MNRIAQLAIFIVLTQSIVVQAAPKSYKLIFHYASGQDGHGYFSYDEATHNMSNIIIDFSPRFRAFVTTEFGSDDPYYAGHLGEKALFEIFSDTGEDGPGYPSSILIRNKDDYPHHINEWPLISGADIQILELGKNKYPDNIGPYYSFIFKDSVVIAGALELVEITLADKFESVLFPLVILPLLEE